MLGVVLQIQSPSRGGGGPGGRGLNKAKPCYIQTRLYFPKEYKIDCISDYLR